MEQLPLLGQIVIHVLFCILLASFTNSHHRQGPRSLQGNVQQSIRVKYLEGTEYEYEFPLMGQEPKTPVEEFQQTYWTNAGVETLQQAMKKKPNTNRAKNVIMFLGDGMSLPTIAAARIFKGQRSGDPGEGTRLFFEDFPSVGLSKTYCTDTQVADSACSSTAYLCGVKGAYYTAGVNGNVRREDCASALNESNQVNSIVQWAQTAGLATGVITNTRITHASPSGAYAHTASREWESDSYLGIKGSQCKDIAHQLIFNSPGKNINVLMGGGRRHFLPKGTPYNGSRSDGSNLIEKWNEGKHGKRAKYVGNRADLLKLDTAKTDYVLGLFASSHLEYYVDADHDNEPSLAEMTEKSIEILKNDPKGFFLFVEGGKIDIAHHENWAHKAMVETVEFEKAVQKAASMTSEEDTLIVVTADHSHSFSLNGYPRRGQSIFGFSDEMSDMDFKPYSTLSYSNGPVKPKLDPDNTRYNLTNDNREDTGYQFSAMVHLGYETHGGDDIGVYARGPWAHLLDGQFDQTYIPIVMGYALNVLPFSASSAISIFTASKPAIISLAALSVIFRMLFL